MMVVDAVEYRKTPHQILPSIGWCCCFSVFIINSTVHGKIPPKYEWNASSYLQRFLDHSVDLDGVHSKNFTQYLLTVHGLAHKTKSLWSIMMEQMKYFSSFMRKSSTCNKHGVCLCFWMRQMVDVTHSHPHNNGYGYDLFKMGLHSSVRRYRKMFRCCCLPAILNWPQQWNWLRRK